MKTLFKRLVPGLLLCVGLSGPALAQTRVGTVSMQKVFDNYWKTKQGDAVLKERVADIDKSNKEMLEGWKKGKEDWQKLLESANDQAVSGVERDKRKKAAEDKLAELKRTEDNIGMFQRQAASSLNEQRAQMRKKILDEIKSVITSKAKTGGYALVIDSDAQTLVPDPAGPYAMPMLLYSNGENDLTEPVLAQLNATAPIDISSPEDKKDQPKDEKKPVLEEKKPEKK